MKSQQGGVLLFVVILSFSISIITISVLTAMANTTKSVDTLSNIDLLRQQNSAAIRATIDKLKDIERVDEIPSSIHVLDRDVYVTVTKEESGYWRELQLEVKASAKGQEHIVSQLVDKKPPFPFQYAIYAEESIAISSIEGPSTINGSPYAMYAEKEMNLSHNPLYTNKASINGWLSYSDAVPDFNITGYNISDFNWLQIEETKFPTFNYNKAMEIAKSNNCYKSIDLTVDISTATLDYQCGEILYIEGDLTVIGEIKFNGLVVVTGTLQFAGDSNITAGTEGLIFVGNDIRVDAKVLSGTKVNGIFYTPNKLDGIVGKLDLEGSIVAKSIEAFDEVNVNFDHDLYSRIPISIWSLFEGIQMNSFDWQETVN